MHEHTISVKEFNDPNELKRKKIRKLLRLNGVSPPIELAERITVVVAAVSVAAAACSFKSIFKSHAEKMTIFSEIFLVRF